MRIPLNLILLFSLAASVLTPTVAVGQTSCQSFGVDLPPDELAQINKNGQECFKEQNYEEAIKWWTELKGSGEDCHAVEHRIGSAEYNIGLTHIELNKRDIAAQYFAKAAAKGIHQAQYNLGVLYWEENDPLLSYAWIKVAADADETYEQSLRSLGLTEDAKVVAEAIAQRLRSSITAAGLKGTLAN